jgi:hypothetical protein
MKNFEQDFLIGLMKQAERRMYSETTDPYGFNPCDFSGGNYDDAYYGGVDDGETGVARSVLDHLKIPYKIPEEKA